VLCCHVSARLRLTATSAPAAQSSLWALSHSDALFFLEELLLPRYESDFQDDRETEAADFLLDRPSLIFVLRSTKAVSVDGGGGSPTSTPARKRAFSSAAKQRTSSKPSFRSCLALARSKRSTSEWMTAEEDKHAREHSLARGGVAYPQRARESRSFCRNYVSSRSDPLPHQWH
jgi:hypothetical protein